MLEIDINYKLEPGLIVDDMLILSEGKQQKKYGNKYYLVQCLYCGQERLMKDIHIKNHSGTRHGQGCTMQKWKDNPITIGSNIGDMTILNYNEKSDKYEVECNICGAKKEISNKKLRTLRGIEHGKGCSTISHRNNPIIVGDTVDDMVVTDIIKNKRQFKVKCTVCGKEKFIHDTNLYRHKGTIHSFRTCDYIPNIGSEHPELSNIYSALKQRTGNPNNPGYKDYGARGIRNEFKDLQHFIDTMAESYYEHVRIYGRENTSLDRRDNDGNYSPDNCRWATWDEQVNNKRVLKTQREFIAVSPDGTEYRSWSMQKFAKDHDLSSGSIHDCLLGVIQQHKGWTFEYFINK